MKKIIPLLVAGLLVTLKGPCQTVDYEVYAIKFAAMAHPSPLSDWADKAPTKDSVNIDFMVWLIKGKNGKNILVDAGFLKDIKGKIKSEYGHKGHFMYEEFSELKKSNPEMFSPKGMKPDVFLSEIAKKYPEIFNYKDPETLSSEDLVQAAFMAKKLKGGK